MAKDLVRNMLAVNDWSKKAVKLSSGFHNSSKKLKKQINQSTTRRV